MPHTYKARRGGYNWPEGGAPTPPACLCSTWAYGGGMGAFELHYAAGKFMSCIMQLIVTHPPNRRSEITTMGTAIQTFPTATNENTQHRVRCKHREALTIRVKLQATVVHA